MMAHNSDAQKNLPAQHWIVCRNRILWWVCGAAVLVALLLWASWRTYQRGVFSVLWGKWQAFHQSPTWDSLVGPTFVLLALLGLVVLWKGPQWQVAQIKGLDPKERFDRENEARKTLATILGGIVLLTGGFFTWRNIKVAQESLRVSQEGQITDRFTKAIEQLGTVDAQGMKKMVVRLGGIYALELIANESERDHWPIMEVLCTYVRNVAPIKPQQSTRENQASSQSPRSPTDEHPEADIQAILTVLGRRDRKYETKDRYLDLSHADLSGAHLWEADLSKAHLTGAHLRRAYLSRADLSGADLGFADLSGAVLSGADLSGADLGFADLSGADLSGAFFLEAHLREADLSGAHLSGARDLTQAQIDQATGDSSTILDLRMPESWKRRNMLR